MRARRLPALSLALLSLAAAATAHAADFTFNGNGNWSASGNWLNNLIPVNDPTTHVVFSPTSPSAVTSTADAARASWILNALTINHTNSIALDTLTTVPGASLDFQGSNPFIEMTNSNGRPTLAGNITSSSQLTLRAANGIASSPFTLSASITAPSLAITSGFIALSGTNTLAGGMTVTSGSTPTRLTLSTPAALGTGPLTISSGITPFSIRLSLVNGAGSSTAYANDLIVNGTASGANALNFDFPTALANHQFIFQSLTLNGNAILATPITSSTNSVAFQSVTLINTPGLFDQPAFNGIFSLANVSGAGPLAVGILGNVTLTSANAYGGGTVIHFGALAANAAGALASGPIDLQTNSTLSLNATAAANSDISGSFGNGTLNYNANNAANGHVLTASTLNLGPAVTSLGGDTFVLPIGNGYLSGNSATLALLTRGGNLTLPAGSFVENTDGLLPTVNNLGAAADLFLALHTTSPLTVTVGTGTPWEGIAGGRTGSFVGTVTPASDFSLAGGSFGSGAAASFNITAASPVLVSVASATLNSPLSNYSGVASFNVTGTLTLSSTNALGGGSATSTVPLSVANGALLAIENATAVNGLVTLHAGSTLAISSAGLSGSGTLARDPGGVTFSLGNAAAFSGTQLTPAFVSATDTLLLSVSNITNLQSLNPAATFVINSSIPNTQAAGFNLNAGTLRLASGASLNAASSGDNTVHAGALGATLQVNGSFTPLSAATGLADVAIPIVASAALTIGNTDLSDLHSHGVVALSAANTLPAITINYAGLAVASQAALGAGPVTLNHAYLGLYSLKPAFPATTATYTNTLNVIGDSLLTDASDVHPSSSTFHNSTASSLAVGTVNLGALLQLQYRVDSFTIAELHPTADSTLALVNPFTPVSISALTADTSPHALTFKGLGGHATFNITGPAADTGPIFVDNATLNFQGSVASSSGAITLDNNSAVIGATISRPLILDDASLGNFNAGPISTAALTLGDQSLLQFALNAPTDSANTLLHITGNLILDGILSLQPGAGFAPGDYTLLTYTGSLTDNTLTLPGSTPYALSLITSTPGLITLHVAAPVPEPASLSLLLLAAPLLLRRKR